MLDTSEIAKELGVSHNLVMRAVRWVLSTLPDESDHIQLVEKSYKGKAFTAALVPRSSLPLVLTRLKCKKARMLQLDINDSYYAMSNALEGNLPYTEQVDELIKDLDVPVPPSIFKLVRLLMVTSPELEPIADLHTSAVALLEHESRCRVNSLNTRNIDANAILLILHSEVATRLKELSVFFKSGQ